VDVWNGATRSAPAAAKAPAQHVTPPAPVQAPKPAAAAADTFSEALF
jgi:hypothetical protein